MKEKNASYVHSTFMSTIKTDACEENVASCLVDNEVTGRQRQK